MAKRSITVEFEEPSAELLASAAHLSGLEFLQGIIDGTHPAAPIAELMGYRLVEVAEGFAAFEGEPSERVYNPIGMVHGGFAMTLIDSATACAVQTTLPAGTAYSTVETKVNLTRAIRHDSGLLRCEAKLVHAGSRIASAESRVTDADGKLYAHGTSTCLIYELKS